MSSYSCDQSFPSEEDLQRDDELIRASEEEYFSQFKSEKPKIEVIYQKLARSIKKEEEKIRDNLDDLKRKIDRVDYILDTFFCAVDDRIQVNELIKRLEEAVEAVRNVQKNWEEFLK